jgi:hypothetical protein
MNDFTKVYRIGTAKTYGGRFYSIYVKAEYKDGILSITGVEGPLASGNCLGGCGQIDVELKPENLYNTAPGWTVGSIKRLMEIWDRWHLNDMRAGCEHQRANWDTKKKVELINYSPSVQYNDMFNRAQKGLLTLRESGKLAALIASVGLVTTGANKPKYETEEVKALLEAGWIVVKSREVKSVNWVYPYEHPEGILMKPCEVCGYQHGSACLKEDVPEDVLQELMNFPNADRKPAWV